MSGYELSAAVRNTGISNTDSLYRLTDATEKTGSTTNWSQQFAYDRYGNRVGFAQNISGITDAPNPTIDENTNRFNSSQGFAYDKNGNIITDTDPNSSLTRSFVFNGDNKQVEVKDVNGNAIGKYFFDGERKRVWKLTQAICNPSMNTSDKRKKAVRSGRPDGFNSFLRNSSSFEAP